MAITKSAADFVTIQHISLLLDQLEKASLKQQKKQQQRMSSKCFIEFFKRFTNDGLTMEDSFTPFTLEMMMRLLCPCLDTSRKYGLKEYMLSDLISSYPYLSVEAGKIIKHWNGSNTSRDDSNIFFIEKTTGNLGSSVEEAFRASFGSSSSQTGQRYPTLRRMAQLLDELASLSSFTTEPITKSKRSRDSIIADLYGNQDPSVCKWITRILLKNLLPMKLDPYQVLGSFHPCLRRIYFMTSCLRETSVRLADLFKDRQFHNENIFYGDDQDLNLNIYKKALEHCCKPNLGTRISSMESIQCKSVSHAYHSLLYEWGESEGFLCELKYDGERMQIHFNSDGFSTTKSECIRIYSKSGRDSTSDREKAHKIIRNSLPERVKSCILEAELLTFDRHSEKIQRFGGVSSFTRTKVASLNRSVNLYIVFFDVLYLNDVSLIGVPLSHRRQVLQDVIAPIEHQSQLSEAVFYKMPSLPRESWTLDMFAPLREHFRKVKGYGDEGLMIKGISCPYIPGRRANWMKMKPDYMAGLADEAEYVLIGAGWEPDPYLSSVAYDDCFGMNLFFVGVLLNQRKINSGTDTKPIFGILSTVENGFTCEELETVAVYMEKKRKKVPKDKFYMKRVVETEHYSFVCHELTDNLGKMAYYFEEPLCVTLKGSSYEDRMRMNRQEGDENRESLWMLRHPRVERIWLDMERDWTTATTFEELQEKGDQSMRPTATSLEHLEECLLYFDAFYCTYKRLYIAPRTKTLEDPKEMSYSLFEDCALKALVDSYHRTKGHGQSTVKRKTALEYTVESQCEGSQINFLEVLDEICIVNPPRNLNLPDTAKCIGPQSVFTAAGWHCSAQQQHIHYTVYIFLDAGMDEPSVSRVLEAIEEQQKVGKCSGDVKPIIIAGDSLHVIATYDNVY